MVKQKQAAIIVLRNQCEDGVLSLLPEVCWVQCLARTRALTVR